MTVEGITNIGATPYIYPKIQYQNSVPNYGVQNVAQNSYAAPFAYPSNYYVSVPKTLYPNVNPYTTQYQTNPIVKKTVTGDYEFENIYNKFCTLEGLQKVVPQTSIVNKDFDNEKMHFYNTYNYAIKLANTLKLSENDKETLKMASILHDIGKVLVPSEILNKQGALSQNERAIIDMHSSLGYEIAKTKGFPAEILDVIKNHHNNQKTDNILTEIVKISDRYDALTSIRPYKRAFTRNEALNILRDEVLADKINPSVYNAFLTCV